MPGKAFGFFHFAGCEGGAEAGVVAGANNIGRHGQIQAATTTTKTHNQKQSGRLCLLHSTKALSVQLSKQINAKREQAKLYGVSETRILTLLHDAYSQNYSYLIKKATDQYQVILEVADNF